MRNVHTRRCIGGTGATRDKTNAGTAREFALGLSHHGRATFLAADGDSDRRVVQGIKHSQKTFAGYAKELLNAMGQQLIDKNLAAGAAKWYGHDSTR